MTKRKMFFKMILSSLLKRRSRMFVALLSVAIGATVLSGMVTIYLDMPQQMGQEFRSYGANMILVSADEETGISEEDAVKAKELLPAEQLIGATPYRYETIKINERPIIAAGTDFEQLKKTSPFWQVEGEYPANPDEILIGAEVASMMQLTKGDTVDVVLTDSTGETVTREFTVSGIVKTGQAEESMIFMELSVLDQMMKDTDSINVVEVSIAATSEEITNMAATIENAVPSITPRLVKQVTEGETSVLSRLQALVYIVTVIVLLLTMICVGTTMMAVVSSRRKEIGLKKAIGAENKSIVYEFLGEGLALGFFGGVVGCVLGYFFAQSISMHVFFRPVVFPWWIVPITIIASVVVTGIACLIPIRMATDVEPAVVLRGE